MVVPCRHTDPFRRTFLCADLPCDRRYGGGLPHEYVPVGSSAAIPGRRRSSEGLPGEGRDAACPPNARYGAPCLDIASFSAGGGGSLRWRARRATGGRRGTAPC